VTERSIEKLEEHNEAICKREKMPNKEFHREQVAKTRMDVNKPNKKLF